MWGAVSVKMERIDIIAYQHTSKRAGKSILNEGFDLNKHRRVSIGYGVQCFLDLLQNPIYANTNGQLAVEYGDCRIWTDSRQISEMLDRIQEAESANMRDTAIDEA